MKLHYPQSRLPPAWVTPALQVHVDLNAGADGRSPTRRELLRSASPQTPLHNVITPMPSSSTQPPGPGQPRVLEPGIPTPAEPYAKLPASYFNR